MDSNADRMDVPLFGDSNDGIAAALLGSNDTDTSILESGAAASNGTIGLIEQLKSSFGAWLVFLEMSLALIGMILNL